MVEIYVKNLGYFVLTERENGTGTLYSVWLKEMESVWREEREYTVQSKSENGKILFFRKKKSKIKEENGKNVKETKKDEKRRKKGKKREKKSKITQIKLKKKNEEIERMEKMKINKKIVKAAPVNVNGKSKHMRPGNMKNTTWN